MNNVFNTFGRSNDNLLAAVASSDEIAKETSKNIFGVSYRYRPNSKFSLTAFGKQYHQYVAGPVATSAAQDKYVKITRSVDAFGYGAAGTWFMPLGFQLKASYEKAYRLPTIEEMFGDEDLEVGDMALKPESSHNLNLNLSYNAFSATAQSMWKPDSSIVTPETTYNATSYRLAEANQLPLTSTTGKLIPKA